MSIHFAPRRLQTSLTVLGTLLMAAGAAHADPSPALDRFSASVGAFYAEPKIQFGADTNNGRLTSPDQKLDKVTLPRAKIERLLGDRHGLAFDYYRYDKSYSPDVAASTVINGQGTANATAADATLRIDLAQLAYKWWLGRGNDVFGVGLGAAYYEAKLSGSASGLVQANAGGASSVSGTGTASESTYAPLIEFGWRHAFTPDFRLYADASGIKKNGGSLHGHIYSGSLGLEWFPIKNVGLVLDYGVQKIALSSNGNRNADLNIHLTGPSAFVKVRF